MNCLPRTPIALVLVGLAGCGPATEPVGARALEPSAEPAATVEYASGFLPAEVQAILPAERSLAARIDDVVRAGILDANSDTADYLHDNKQVSLFLDTWLEAERQEARMQVEPGPEESPADASLLQSRDVCRLLLLEARWQQHLGNGDGALADCLAGLRFAREHYRGETAIIPLVTGWALQSLAQPCFVDLVLKGEVSRDAWHQASLQLGRMSAGWPSLEAVYRSDRAAMLEMTEQSLMADLGPDGEEQVALTLQHLRELDGEFEDIFGQAYRERDAGIFERATLALEHELEDLQSAVDLSMFASADQRAEMSAKVVLVVSLPKMGTLIGLDGLRRAELELMRTAACVRLYHADHGELPAELTDLMPLYLEALPLDPFAAAEEPLRWALTSEGWSLYSLGPDGSDDGGAQTFLPAKPELGGDIVLVVAAQDR